MKPPPFDYIAAATAEEAVALLAANAGAAKLLAGGQSLMPMLNFRLLEPDLLIDIGRIPALAAIAAEPGGLRVGAGVRHRQFAEDPIVRARFPIARAVMAHVAHIAIRNRGSFGGSLAHADPAAELPMLVLLLDAGLRILGPNGGRDLAAADFFLGPLTTALEEDELLLSAFLPDLPDGAGWGFEETARRTGDFALAGAGAILSVRSGVVAEARVAVLGVDETPLRIGAAEALLAGRTFDAEARGAAAAAVRDAVQPMGDLQASADFRRHLAGVMAARALDAAWAHAR